MTAKLLASLTLLTLLSGCSTLGGWFTKKVEVSSAPIEIEIMQPTLPRPINLENPKWYVVSEAVIANPCKAVPTGEVKDDGTPQTKRPKDCTLEDREHPDWPIGYTYLDKFLDEMKKLNNGDVVFVAMTIGDYEMMSGNVQELRRYIRELGEVIVYYRNVTIKDKPAVGVAIEKN